MKFKFDHSKDSIIKACGLTEKQTVALFHKINDTVNTCNCHSEMIEVLSKNFSTEELAFVIHHLRGILSEMEEKLMMIKNPIFDLSKDLEKMTSMKLGKA